MFYSHVDNFHYHVNESSIKITQEHLLFANDEYIRLDLLQIRYHDKRTFGCTNAGGKKMLNLPFQHFVDLDKRDQFDIFTLQHILSF